MSALESPNRRIGQLKRFLSKPPRGTAGLVLAVPEGECPAVLARWDKSQSVPELAHDIECLVAEHADESASYVAARLEWHTKDGEVLASKVVRGRPSEGSEFDGSQQSQAAQAQRHTEAMTRLYVSAHSATIDRLNNLVEQLAGIAASSLEAARDRAEDAEVARAAAAEAIREGEESRPANGPSERVMKLAELAVMAQLNGGNGGGGSSAS